MFYVEVLICALQGKRAPFIGIRTVKQVIFIQLKHSNLEYFVICFFLRQRMVLATTLIEEKFPDYLDDNF